MSAAASPCLHPSDKRKYFKSHLVEQYRGARAFKCEACTKNLVITSDDRIFEYKVFLTAYGQQK